MSLCWNEIHVCSFETWFCMGDWNFYTRRVSRLLVVLKSFRSCMSILYFLRGYSICQWLQHLSPESAGKSWKEAADYESRGGPRGTEWRHHWPGRVGDTSRWFSQCHPVKGKLYLITFSVSNIYYIYFMSLYFKKLKSCQMFEGRLIVWCFTPYQQYFSHLRPVDGRIFIIRALV